MSVRTELQEVIEWISDLATDERPAPAPETPSRTDWRNLKANLEDVAEDLAHASTALGDAPLAELARDLSREAEGLALRAAVLVRRAPDEAPKPKAAKAAPPPASPAPSPPPAPPPASPAAAEHAEPPLAPLAGDTEPEEPKEKPQKTAADHVRAASGTIETAYEKFEDLRHPDEATKEFENDLDLLAEMTLSLRQRIVDTEI